MDHSRSENGTTPKYSIGTLAVQAGQHPRQEAHGAVIPPIYLSCTYYQPSPGQPVTKYDYARSGNPTRDGLETALAAIEEAKYALAFSSGLATQMTVIQSLVKSGQHIVCCEDCYGGTGRQLRTSFVDMDIMTTFVEGIDADSFAEAIIPNKTKMVWIESPTNPCLKLIDLKAVGEAVKRIDPSIVYVVDNTFMSSVLQQPLKLGADIVTHALTKYMNGHSDVVMGALMTNNEHYYNKLKFQQNALGAIPSPFDCFLVNRGLKTLHIRMERHCSNAMAVARFLEGHPKVKRVLYPGLESHPQHELAKKQNRNGFSGMLSFYVASSDPDAGRKVVSSLKIFSLAVSLGGIESLVEIPCFMSHACTPLDVKENLEVNSSLIRLSVGIEDVRDIIADLQQALDRIPPVPLNGIKAQQ